MIRCVLCDPLVHFHGHGRIQAALPQAEPLASLAWVSLEHLDCARPQHLVLPPEGQPDFQSRDDQTLKTVAATGAATVAELQFLPGYDRADSGICFLRITTSGAVQCQSLFCWQLRAATVSGCVTRIKKKVSRISVKNQQESIKNLIKQNVRSRRTLLAWKFYRLASLPLDSSRLLRAHTLGADTVLRYLGLHMATAPEGSVSTPSAGRSAAFRKSNISANLYLDQPLNRRLHATKR